MPERIALFASKTEVEAFFDTTTSSDSLFDPHYNIAPAHHILLAWQDESMVRLQRVRWGLNEQGGEASSHEIDPERAEDRLKEPDHCRCVIPISGFYLWKESGKRAAYPFFVRLLDNPVMAVAGVARIERPASGAGTVAKLGGCAIITTPATVLLQPLSARMPLLIDRNLAEGWMKGTVNLKRMEEAVGRYLLSDLSVLRVSNKVGDLEQNSPKLIQPLPK